MSTCFDSHTRRAAKRYRCYYCAQRIEVGEKHVYAVGTTDGDFWSMRAHPECDAYAQEHWDYGDWECHEPGEFTRPMDAFDPCI